MLLLFVILLWDQRWELLEKKSATQNGKLHKPIELLHKTRRLMTFRKVKTIFFCWKSKNTPHC